MVAAILSAIGVDLVNDFSIPPGMSATRMLERYSDQ